jgi:hypothetical protein
MNKQTNEIYLHLASKADTGIRISDSLSENSLRFTVYKQCPNTVHLPILTVHLSMQVSGTASLNDLQIVNSLNLI